MKVFHRRVENMLGLSFLSKTLTKQPLFRQELVATFRWRPPRETGHGTNYHRSNQAKEGKYKNKFLIN